MSRRSGFAPVSATPFTVKVPVPTKALPAVVRPLIAMPRFGSSRPPTPPAAKLLPDEKETEAALFVKVVALFVIEPATHVGAARFGAAPKAAADVRVVEQLALKSP